MDAIGKFDADVRKVLKRGGGAAEIAELFVATAPDLGGLEHIMANLWLKNQGNAEPDIDTRRRAASPECNTTGVQQPRLAGSVDWLAEALAVLLGTELAAESNVGRGISDDDWAEIRDAVTAEAEDLPLETLEGMMQVFIEKGLV
jgi:hypothetical protein